MCEAQHTTDLLQHTVISQDACEVFLPGSCNELRAQIHSCLFQKSLCNFSALEDRQFVARNHQWITISYFDLIQKIQHQDGYMMAYYCSVQERNEPQRTMIGGEKTSKRHNRNQNLKQIINEVKGGGPATKRSFKERLISLKYLHRALLFLRWRSAGGMTLASDQSGNHS